MTISRSTDAAPSFPARHTIELVRHYLGGRWGLVALAVVAVGAGLAFNWSWLVAAGIAPLLLAVLPCVAMCALGLRMSQMMGRSDTSRSSPDATFEPSASPRAPVREVEPSEPAPADSADQLTMDLGER